MLQVMLILEGHVQGFHTRRESLSGVEIKVGKADLIAVSRSFGLEDVEVNSVMV